MYALKEAALLAQGQIRDDLAKHGYNLFKLKPCMWRHKTYPSSSSRLPWHQILHKTLQSGDS